MQKEEKNRNHGEQQVTVHSDDDVSGKQELNSKTDASNISTCTPSTATKSPELLHNTSNIKKNNDHSIDNSNEDEQIKSPIASGHDSKSPAPQKTQYIFSNIFEKQEDIKNNPFEFQKHNLKPRKSDQDYGTIKIQSILIRPKKSSQLAKQPVQLNDINNDTDDINMDNSIGECHDQANFKQKYFIYFNHKIIQFNHEKDTQERGILDIKYARLKKTHLKDSQQKMYGFIIMAKGQCLQLYTLEQEVQLAWIEKLKSSCILLDLKEEFILGPLLGRGNFAKVHSCTRKSDPDETKYALKTIEKSGIKKCKRNIQSVLMEIDILRTLQHPFIIQLHEVYESNKYIHLVLSYLDGGELFERIKSRQVYQEKTAIQVMKNMLEALKYMHFHKVVHRDLKPENLILASKQNDYDLRIADFGLAYFMPENGDLLKLRCGSPGYVAPELLEDVGYDEKADIFSAGVILYVLLSGRPAFRGYNINEILTKNKKGEVEYPAKFWDKISDKAKDLVQLLLRKNPKERISAEDALNHPWFHQDESEMNEQKLDFANTIKDEEENFKIDYNKLNDAEEEEIKLVSCTPVMAKRNLNPGVPETPFMKSNIFNRANATPMMTGNIKIQQAAPPKVLQINGGIQILKPQVQASQANQNAKFVIPPFKGRGRSGGPGAAPGGPPTFPGLGRGRGRGAGPLGNLKKLENSNEQIIAPQNEEKKEQAIVDQKKNEEIVASNFEDAKIEDKIEQNQIIEKQISIKNQSLENINNADKESEKQINKPQLNSQNKIQSIQSLKLKDQDQNIQEESKKVESKDNIQKVDKINSLIQQQSQLSSKKSYNINQDVDQSEKKLVFSREQKINQDEPQSNKQMSSSLQQIQDQMQQKSQQSIKSGNSIKAQNLKQEVIQDQVVEVPVKKISQQIVQSQEQKPQRLNIFEKNKNDPDNFLDLSQDQLSEIQEVQDSPKSVFSKANQGKKMQKFQFTRFIRLNFQILWIQKLAFTNQNIINNFFMCLKRVILKHQILPTYDLATILQLKYIQNNSQYYQICDLNYRISTVQKTIINYSQNENGCTYHSYASWILGINIFKHIQVNKYQLKVPQLQIGEIQQLSQEEQMMRQFVSDPNVNQNASQQMYYIGTQIIQKIEKQLQLNKNMFQKNYEKINRVFNAQKDQIIERNDEDDDPNIPDIDGNDNYLSSRYAEYLNSNRKQPSGQINSKRVQLPGIFKPGFNENILQRKIRNFEEHGYGLINLQQQGHQMQTKIKNKFQENITNENKKRVFIDLQGNQIEQLKQNDQKLEQNDQNKNNIQNMCNNIINQQYMMQQQQYMLQGFNYPQASDENNPMIYNQVYEPIQQINVNQQYNILNVEDLKNQISSPIDQIYFNNQSNFINPIYNPQNIQFNNQIPQQMQNQGAFIENQVINQNVNYQNPSQIAQGKIEQELQGPQEQYLKNISNIAVNNQEEQKIGSSQDKKSIVRQSMQCNSQQSGVMGKVGSSNESKNQFSYKQVHSSQSSQMSQKSGSRRRQQPFHEYKFSIAQQQDYIQEEEEFKADK